MATSLFCPSFAYYVPQNDNGLGVQVRTACIFAVGFGVLYPLIHFLEGR